MAYGHMGLWPIRALQALKRYAHTHTGLRPICVTCIRGLRPLMAIGHMGLRPILRCNILLRKWAFGPYCFAICVTCIRAFGPYGPSAHNIASQYCYVRRNIASQYCFSILLRNIALQYCYALAKLRFACYVRTLRTSEASLRFNVTIKRSFASLCYTQLRSFASLSYTHKRSFASLCY